ncbi:DUF4157 domain-containing protein [Spirulina sp. 06S082]|uniref:eCIS core domain-containing protein n=1 Tax=Spirulina sp. 06S082 TaxID=3110248 RepID=UPI002B214562|nr:DUF4157 domain-containing protein [Spirulina sp. 06S082]MEA5470576.1 DUF4157 domain-containing protein [Spirulina sp. 06S082]
MGDRQNIPSSKTNQIPQNSYGFVSHGFVSPPVVQAKKKTEKTALPEWQPSADNWQTNSQNPLGGMYSNNPSSTNTTPIQAKLTLGKIGDPYEQEADRVAKEVVQRIHTPETPSSPPENPVQMKPTLQRQDALGGGEIPNEIESAIDSARGGGQPLDNSLQQSMGGAMGADFSNVKVHTDSQADRLNQSLQAKAFTTGQDVFFRQGAYNPKSKGGQELVAHELTHVMQQNGNAVQPKSLHTTPQNESVVQPVFFDSDLNKHYSHALKAQEITATNGVITAVASGGLAGGHTIIYTERLNAGQPESHKIDLTVGAKSGGSSGTTDMTSSGTTSSSSGTGYEEITITNKVASDESLARIGGGTKKSWVTTPDKIVKAQEKAEDVKANKAKYSYTMLGVSPFKKNAINCARFGEVVLKAAGIPEASAGKVIKKPSTLAEGGDVGYTPDDAYFQNEQRKADEERQRKLDAEALKQQALLNQQRYAKIPKVLKGTTFTDGKTVMGASTYEGAMTTQYTFRPIPDGGTEAMANNEIELTPFKIITFADVGRGQIERRDNRGSIYVSLDVLFDNAGNVITT